MPEEIINNQAPASATDIADQGMPAPDPEPEIRYASADTIDQPDSGKGASEGEEESGQVPSFRLREEMSRRREAEQAFGVAQQQMQLLQNQLQQQQQQQVPVENVEDELRKPFGADEDGNQAYQAVRGVSEQVVNEMRQGIRDELQSDFDVKLGSVTASMQMAEELAGMKTNGLIDDVAEKEIGRRMGEQIRNNPAWGQPANQRHLLNQVWTDMLRNGDIRPTTRPATPSGGSMPLQPGATRLTTKQMAENNDAELLEIQRRHPKKFGNMTLDQLRELGGPGTSTHTTGPSPEPAQGQPHPARTYTHTRG